MCSIRASCLGLAPWRNTAPKPHGKQPRLHYFVQTLTGDGGDHAARGVIHRGVKLRAQRDSVRALRPARRGRAGLSGLDRFSG